MLLIQETRNIQDDEKNAIAYRLDDPKRMFEFVDEQTKYIVNGYIRQYLETNEWKLNLPQEINVLCMLFAGTPPTHFKTYTGHGISYQRGMLRGDLKPSYSSIVSQHQSLESPDQF